MRAHLQAHADELKRRAAYQRGNCKWWQYTWSLHAELYGIRKRILCPYLAASNRFALDAEDRFISLTDTTVLFENGQSESLPYLLGLLNSRLLTFRFASIGKLKSGGIYEYFWNSVSRLCVRRIDLSNKPDQGRHDRMVSLVEQMLAAKKTSRRQRPVERNRRAQMRRARLPDRRSGLPTLWPDPRRDRAGERRDGLILLISTNAARGKGSTRVARGFLVDLVRLHHDVLAQPRGEIFFGE